MEDIQQPSTEHLASNIYVKAMIEGRIMAASFDKQKGFTILEMVFAIGLLAVAATLSIFAMIGSYQISSRTLVRTELQEEVRALADRIVRDLRFSSVSCDAWNFPDLEPVTSFSFSQCTGFDPTTAFRTWGDVITYQLSLAPGETENGIDDNGDGLVDESALYYTRGSQPAVIIASNLVSGQTRFLREGNRVTIWLTAAKRDPQSQNSLITASCEARAVFRN